MAERRHWNNCSNGILVSFARDSVQQSITACISEEIVAGSVLGKRQIFDGLEFVELTLRETHTKCSGCPCYESGHYLDEDGLLVG